MCPEERTPLLALQQQTNCTAPPPCLESSRARQLDVECVRTLCSPSSSPHAPPLVRRAWQVYRSPPLPTPSLPCRRVAVAAARPTRSFSPGGLRRSSPCQGRGGRLDGASSCIGELWARVFDFSTRNLVWDACIISQASTARPAPSGQPGPPADGVRLAWLAPSLLVVEGVRPLLPHAVRCCPNRPPMHPLTVLAVSLYPQQRALSNVRYASGQPCRQLVNGNEAPRTLPHGPNPHRRADESLEPVDGNEAQRIGAYASATPALPPVGSSGPATPACSWAGLPRPPTAGAGPAPRPLLDLQVRGWSGGA